MTKRSFRLIGLGILLGIILAACGAAGTQAPSAPAQGQGSSGTQDEAADRAPNFEISLYQGQDAIGSETVTIDELLARGQPIVLNFWAGLCPPCRIEMPDLERVYQNHKGEMVLIGVDVGPFTNLGSRDEGRDLLQELEVGYPAGTTFSESIMQEYQVLGMPSTYFIKPDGTIHETWSGLLTEEKMEELVDELLEASEAG